MSEATYEVCNVDILPCGERAKVMFNFDVLNKKDVTLSLLPEHIKGKLAVMRMVGNGEIVAGIGYRIGDNSFLIYL